MDKRLAWGIGVALGGIALTLAATFLPDREVHYSLSLNVFNCQNADGGARLCTAWGRLSVGNTGNVEQSVVLQCVRCAEDSVRALQPGRIRVEAAARVVEGDPRVTTLLRGLMNLLRVVLPVA